MMRNGLAACLLILVCASALAAEEVVILVRHAERADNAAGGAGMMASDPDLSAEGRARAATLARTLRDAGITAVFTTQYKRTQQTAAPLAKALGLEPVVVASSESAAVIEKIRAAGGTVLVVGHSNSVPELLKRLGVTEQVAIEEQEFDNLFVVVPGAPPTLVRLRY